MPLYERDLSGMKFGILMAVSSRKIHKKGQTSKRWLCRCDCGSEREYLHGNLVAGTTRSCGCIRAGAHKLNARHGMSGTRIHKIWKLMRSRCNCPGDTNYPHYGARGISVCARWDSFVQFMKDMGPCPKGFTLERKDCNGNYEPKNCTWIAAPRQHRNCRNSIRLTHNGVTKHILDWCDELKFPYGLAKCRASKGWSFERIFDPKPAKRGRLVVH